MTKTTPTTAPEIAAKDEDDAAKEARRDWAIYLADYDGEEDDATKQARQARREYEIEFEETDR